MAKITIFDTTLRDGEQSPGFSMNMEEKLQMAFQLAALNVDVLEAGFPASSPGDFESVRAIAKKVHGPVICGLARMTEGDIRAAGEAIKAAKKRRIHVFISTSDIHMKYKLRKTRKEVLEMSSAGVALATKFTKDVEFSCEDATRSEPEFMYEVVTAAIKAGATTINLPDTVGYTVPDEYGRLMDGFFSNVPNIRDAIISVHCHNDLGLGVANSVSAIMHGARQVECTVNGIGERAGNASLEEIVMAIKTRGDFMRHTTGVRTKEIYKTSKLLSSLTGIPVQPNKAIVGANAFAHEAGIHQDGVLKRRETYEIMTPQSIGLSQNKMVLGKHSGRHAFSARMAELGFRLSKAQLDVAFKRFKDLADKKKEVFDDDLEAVIGDDIAGPSRTYTLVYFHTTTGNSTVPTATVKLEKNGEVHMSAANGDGPIDALYNAIDKITGVKGRLANYQVRAVTGDKDAVGEVTVQVEFDLRGRSKGGSKNGANRASARGRAASTDTVEASTLAYISALNRVLAERRTT
ncbi:MAG: 2-isopropylmalate synthase [Nitrospinae bacterium]|nr:2-isopropylmalate synthase [Nitrospinota bacterium]